MPGMHWTMRWRGVVMAALWVMQAGSSRQAFMCEEIQDPGVKATEMFLPSVPVPAQNIGRLCSSQLFNPSSSGSSSSSSSSSNNSSDMNVQWHLIAYTPVKGSANVSDVIKRMFLYGCEGEAFSDASMVTNNCEDILEKPTCDLIGAWSPGYHGDCFHGNTGIRIGAGSYEGFVLEVQWDNRSPKPVSVREAGFTLYYTSLPGMMTSSMLKLGDDYVIIPPQSPANDVTSTCTSACTRSLLKEEVFVTAAFSRLNFLGVRQDVTVYRGGKFLQHVFLTNLTSPTGGRQFNFQEPLSLKPGDVIRTTCRYTSLNKTRTTFSSPGDIRDSELCLAYLRFHSPPSPTPSPSFLSCVSWRSLLSCDAATEAGCTGKEREKFRSENFPMTRSYNDVIGKCPVFGVCTEECQRAVAGAAAREPCMAHADSWTRVKVTVLSQSLFGRHFLSALASCELEVCRDSAATTAAGSKTGVGKDERGAGLKREEVSTERRRSSLSGSSHITACKNHANPFQPAVTVYFVLVVLVLAAGHTH